MREKAGHGRVLRLNEVWESCDMMISPVLHGGRVSVKVAQAPYHGMPLLATSCAMRGLPPLADPCIAISDDPEEWMGFLRHRAVEWVQESVSPRVSDYFSPDAHAHRLQQFVKAQQAMGYA